MKVIATELRGLLILEPRVFADNRGFFMQTYQQEQYAQAGIDCFFVQDNLSVSSRHTLRGLHYQQEPHGQAKLVQVLEGAVYDVAVDIRVGSPTFGKWLGVELSAENRRQLFIPVGFAHGFVVTSQRAIFVYKCSTYYAPTAEDGIIFSDPDLAISWPGHDFELSDKDKRYPCLKDIPTERLPQYEE
ncbi:MAG: dTDP-4-dehydrorhamnose 3,5-epimerase [Proteobacteria bacterium]|nr:dTDP-4-dehydrorhamnose 3,5-epimerase [Pseudomonadota bacterium]MBU1641569.1 dTDP-4-dehydrorhamnose 3,5-epimerase [Pseudomonadota bacterium]